MLILRSMDTFTSKSCTYCKDNKQKRADVCRSPSAPAQRVDASTLTGDDRPINTKNQRLLAGNKTEEEISKRPVKCLFHKCSKYVAITDIMSHFWCDHDDVSMIVGDGDNFHIWVAPDDIPADSSTCIALILLVDSQNNSQDKTRKSDVTPEHLRESRPALVMAGRTRLGTAEPAVLFWVSEAEARLSCSVRVTQFSEPGTSVAYSGPTNNLRLDRDLRGVLERGHCAVVLPGLARSLARLTRGFDVSVRVKAA
ncbi:uncharacterized protein LOC134528316 [Bacillus rossius redtenbacheri]|uniref:uncharacterized protein LOC134528316 n=1 Tax=Bacillus rossius redtenbacheri TaxID=93214 RepID=UPI002FDE06EB